MRRFSLLLVTPFALAACGSESLVNPIVPHAATFSAATQPTFAAAVTTSPFHLEFDDFNGCTGEPEHFVFDGTQNVQSFGDHQVIHIAGTVTASDGWVGKFNRQFVFQGDEVTWRFLDMEIGPDGQRQMFTSNLHGTIVDGQIVWTVRNPSLKCVGKPAS